MEGNAACEYLAQLSRRLRWVSRGKISDSFVGGRKAKRVRHVLRTMARLPRRLAKNDYLLALGNQTPHKRDDPVAMFALAAKRLNESLRSQALPGVAIEIAEAAVVANDPLVERN